MGNPPLPILMRKVCHRLFNLTVLWPTLLAPPLLEKIHSLALIIVSAGSQQFLIIVT